MARLFGDSKLSRLRDLMKSVFVNETNREGIQAFILNYGDAHQSEYLRERDKRVKYISGFSGSRGTIIITNNQALLWTDGRYFIQAQQEFDPPGAWTLMKEGVIGTPSQSDWLVSNLPPNSIVGVDANIISYTDWISISTSLANRGHTLISTKENLVDKVWGDERPAVMPSNIVAQPFKYTGRTAKEKCNHIRNSMRDNGVSHLIISALDDVAYMLNWRGSDIPYNPVFLAYIVIDVENVNIFLDKSRLLEEAESQLKEEGVLPVYHPYEDIYKYLEECCNVGLEGCRVWISCSSSYSLHSVCKVSQVHVAASPVALMKLVKNGAEIKGMKEAHIRDGIALVKYFAWLEAQLGDTSNQRVITEMSGAKKLEEFRKELDLYVGPSFETISSSGAHGAIIHYSPSPATDIPITNKELYLCDSGAQFLDGTTDVTRTWHFGKPTDYERECYTRVFKGQCFLNTAKFPKLIKGNYLDTLARKSLWDVGLDYLHGTGHGVGSYLSVHEGGTGISWRPIPDDPGMSPGIFISNEPGFYEDGKFGIRLENIELIVEAKTKYSFKNRTFLTFETVTMCPIQTSLLDINLLTDLEIDYVNNYHEKCRKILQPLLQGSENAQALAWLEKQTKPMVRK